MFVGQAFPARDIFGFHPAKDPYLVPVVRHQLIRNLDSAFPALYDEIGCAVSDLIPANERGVF